MLMIKMGYQWWKSKFWYSNIKFIQNEILRKKINKFLLLHLVFINIMINDYPEFKHKSWYQSDKRKKIWKKQENSIIMMFHQKFFQEILWINIQIIQWIIPNFF